MPPLQNHEVDILHSSKGGGALKIGCIVYIYGCIRYPGVANGKKKPLLIR